VLAVEGLRVKKGERWVVDGLSLEVKQGEVVALAGAMGAGRTATMSALFGLVDGEVEGEVVVDGKRVEIDEPRDAIAAGLALVPEDRKGVGLVLGMSVVENVALPAQRGWLVDAARMEKLASDRVKEMRIKVPGLGAEVATLSGGNQQKVVIGKWLELAPRVLLLDEPTRGVDVGAKAEIYRLIEELTAKGHAVLLASSDLPEIVRLADRVLVLRDGKCVGELGRGEIDGLAIMKLAMGTPPSASREERGSERSEPRRSTRDDAAEADGRAGARKQQ
jgi:ABC-type sugar transport system ATPase subunit